MGTKLLTGLVALLAVLLLLWLQMPGSSSPQITPLTPASGAAPTVAPSVAEEAAAPERQELSPATADAQPVHGRVVDCANMPIEAATLRLKSRAASGSNDPELASATSASDGSFEIPCDPQWQQPFRIFAEAPACTSLSQDPIVPGREVTIRLYRLTWLFGRVSERDTAAPVAGARVQASGEETRTDADGYFELRGAALGADTSVAASCAGFVGDSSTLLVNEPGRTRVDFRLERAVALALQVVDRDTRVPIVGAVVRRFRAGDVLAHTDADGRFSLQVAEGRDLDLEFAAAGYCPLSWSWKVTDAATTMVTLPLQGCATLEGDVVGDDGRPLAKVFVVPGNDSDPRDRYRLTSAELRTASLPGSARDEPPDHGTHTDDRGRFAIAVRPAPSAQYATGALDGYAGARSKDVVLAAAGSRAQVTLVMNRGGSVRGTVLMNGKPFAGSVRCRSAGQQAWDGNAWIRPDGGYELNSVMPGEWDLAVLGRFDTEPVQLVRLQIAAGQRVQHDFQWQVPVGKLTGRVTSSSGRPLPKVTVRATAEKPLRPLGTTRTDDDGRYTLEVAADRTCWVEASRGVTSARRPNVMAGAGAVDFVLPDLGHLRLRLLDAASREPVSIKGSELYCLSWRSCGDEAFRELRRSQLRKLIDSTGLIDLELPLGTVDVSVCMLADGYRPQRLLGMPVVSIASPEPVEVLLVRGVELHIAITGEQPFDAATRKDHLLFLLEQSQFESLRGPFAQQGGPSNWRIGGICMWVGEPGLMRQLLDVQEDGTAVLRGLAPGTYSLRAYPDDFVFTPPTVRVGDQGGTVRLQWRPR